MKNYSAFILLVILIASCAKSVGKNDALDIFVSVLPQKYFVEHITGDKANVHVMVLPGHSPATYEPTPSQMKDISEADMYFSIGVPFEETWINRLMQLNPAMVVVDTRKGVSLRPMDSFIGLKDKISHEHDAEERGMHDHAHQLDPHIWLSPELVKIQANTICAALQEYDPANSEYYNTNLQSFIADLTALQQYFQERLSHLKHREFLVFHPSWGYLADEFDITQIPIQIEGKSPTPSQLAEIIRFAQKEHIRVVFVQKQFSTSTAQTVAKAIGGNVVCIDPLAEDYLGNMRNIADTFMDVLDD